MEREIGRALFVSDGKETMEDKVLKVMESLKEQLKREGIRSLTEEEEEKVDEKSKMKIKERIKDENPKEEGWTLLDNNLLYMMLRHTNAKTLATVACVSKHWQKTAQDERTRRNSMEREIGRALFVSDGKETMEDKVLEVMESLKEQLKREGIRSLTEEEEEKEDEKCNIAIVFITPAFLRDRFRYIEDIEERFRNAYCSAIILGDPQFFDFIHYANKASGGRDGSKPHHTYKISANDAHSSAGHIMLYSYIRYVTIDLQTFDPLDLQPFVQKAAQLFNPLHINFDQLHPDTLVDLKLIDKQLLLQCHNNLNHVQHDPHGDILFTLLVGCECRCSDISSISKFLYMRNLINKRQFYRYRILSPSKIPDVQYNPLALANAFLIPIIIPGTDISLKRLEYIKDPARHLILIEDLDFSSPSFALMQLKNLADMLARGSLVIITTSFTKELADYKIDLRFLRGTTCKKATGWRTFCCRISKSEIYGLDINEKFITLSYPILSKEQDGSIYNGHCII